jgi:hypothetical protein
MLAERTRCMPDITLFEADLSDATFVAPFGHYHEGEEGTTTEDGGRNWKLLGGLSLVAVAAASGGAFALKRKFGGSDEEESEGYEYEADDRFGFEEEFGPEDEERAGELTTEREERESESRTGAVAAVVGLLFLLLVTALVKRRSDGEGREIDVQEEEEASSAVVERDR